MFEEPKKNYPYFKDTVIKNGKLDGEEVLAALKDKKTGAQVKKDLDVIQKFADWFNTQLATFKKNHPTQPEADLFNDKDYKTTIESIRVQWNNAFKDIADSKTFPNGVNITSDDIFPILQQYGAKTPKKTR